MNSECERQEGERAGAVGERVQGKEWGERKERRRGKHERCILLCRQLVYFISFT